MARPLSTLAVVALLVTSLVAGVGGAATAASPGSSPAGHVGVPTSNVDTPSQAQAPTLPAGVPTDAQAWHVSTSKHAGDLAAQIDYSTDGLVVTLTDNQNHDGREVAMNASAIASATGDRPGVAYGRHEDGSQWTSKIEYRNGRAIFTVPRFSTNTVSFDGTVSLQGNYTDGSTSSYNISDLDAVGDNYHINLTGVETTASDDVTATSVGPSSSQSISIGGNKDPTGPSGGTSNPELTVTRDVTTTGHYKDTTKFGAVRGVAVNESRGEAYIAAVNTDMVGVLDVSSPGSPTLKGSISDATALNGTANVDAQGDYLYATAADNNSMAVIDVSTPSTPTIAGDVADTSIDGPTSIVVEGNYAYITSKNSDTLTIVDVSTPSSPTVAGTVASSTNLNAIRDVAVGPNENYAYTVSKPDDEFTVVDISSKTAPAVSNTVTSASVLDGAVSVDQRGDWAYVATRGSANLTVMNVTSPTAASIEGDANTPGTPTEVSVQGDYAYVSTLYGDSIHAVDITTKSAPVTVTEHVDTTYLDGATTVATGPNYAYAVGRSDYTTVVGEIGKTSSLSVSDDAGHSASIGTLAPDEQTTTTLGVNLSSTSLSWSGSGANIDYTLNLSERTVTEDPVVEVNGQTTSYAGKLAAGTTTSLATNTSWIQTGENTVNVTVASHLSSDAPTPTVDLDYHHGAVDNVSVDYGGNHWTETYNASKTYESSRSDATMRVDFVDNVVHVTRLETRTNGGTWSTVSDTDYTLDGQTLTVSLGAVSAGDTVEVRTTGQKVQPVNGDVTVTEPSALGTDLDTKIKMDALTDGFHIEVRNTSTYVHFLANPSWTDDASEYAVIDSSGSQDLYVPTATNGSTARVRNEPLKITPDSGTVDVEVVDAPSNKFTLSGSSSSVDVEVGYFDTDSGETYELQTADGDTVGTKTAQSPVWFLTDGSTETYLIQLADGSGSGGGASSSGAVVVNGGGSPLSDALLLVVVAVLMFATVYVGRRFLGLQGKVLTAMLGVGGAVLGILAIEAIADVSLVATALQIATTGAGSGLTIVIALAILLGLFVVDEGTGLTIPTWMWVVAVAAVGVWVLDTISNGGLTSGLDQVSSLVWLLVLGGTIIIARNALKPDRTILQLRGGKE